MKRVAINGFGRIGRLVYRQLHEIKDIEIVGINDLTTTKELAYLLEYDSSQGKFLTGKISYDNNHVIVDGKKIKIFSERNPKDLPWRQLKVDLVIESTGLFLQKEKAMLHIEAGAKKVLLSAPTGSPDIKTIVYNVNHKTLNSNDIIVSGASCTTNCLALPLNIIENNFGIEIGWMTTIHAATNDQRVLDLPHPKDPRRGRSAMANIIPAATGAATAIGKVIPTLKGKMYGAAFRVPIITGSVVNAVLKLKKNVSVNEVIDTFIKETENNRSVTVTNDPIVSTDTIGIKYGSVIDLELVAVIESGDSQMLKFVAWYDNENSYVSQYVRTLQYMLRI